MSLFLAHLVGDYVLQSHVMATRKTSSWAWALIHACFYGLPFLLLVEHAWQLAVIVGTHALIDRYRLAAYWCRWYGVGFPGIWYAFQHWMWTTFAQGEYFESDAWPEPLFEAPPPFLGVWLIIIVDNTMHLLINAAVLA